MDPDETLRRLRELVRANNYDDYENILEHFDALDEWLSKGGFLPRAWRDEDTE